MREIVIYGNGGSCNHGNEAILRGFKVLMGDLGMTEFSYNSASDKKWGISQLYKIEEQRTSLNGVTLEHIRNYIFRHLALEKVDMKFRFRPFTSKIKKNEIYLLEAGDQYCEPVENKIRSWYEYLNRIINKKGSKSAMLFCTIPVSTLDDYKLIEDLNRYSLIIARETITYNALISKNLKARIVFAPCCAFLMKPKPIELPNIFRGNDVVGITVGELAQNKENYNGQLYQRVQELIHYILENTHYSIALIPHVHGGIPDDLRFSSRLEKEFNSPRVKNVGEHSADQQKYLISKCIMMITVRTHVSIAAYSTCIPTIVIGYSQKSIGIARDLLGTDEHYVINIDDACKSMTLINEFNWLNKNKEYIKEKLKTKLPKYLSNLEIAKKEIENLRNEKYI